MELASERLRRYDLWEWFRGGVADGCGFNGSDFRVTLRRCGWWVWPYLSISHDAVMYLYLHVHKNQQQLLQEYIARVPLTFLPQHFTESLSTLCVSSLHKQLQ